VAQNSFLTGPLVPGFLKHFSQLFFLNLKSNKLVSRSGAIVDEHFDILLNDADFSFAIPSKWIQEFPRLYNLDVSGNLLQGYYPVVPQSSQPLLFSADGLWKWCFDEFSPKNWTYDLPTSHCDLLQCGDCLYFKAFAGFPAGFYPFEDSKLNITILAFSNLSSQILPWTGFTFDWELAYDGVNFTNESIYYLFNETSFSSNWSIASGVTLETKIFLLSYILDFSDVAPQTPYTEVAIFPFSNRTTQDADNNTFAYIDFDFSISMHYPVYNTCYTGNAFNPYVQACFPCTPGYFQQSTENFPECTACPIGYYQNMSGQTYCIKCFGNSSTTSSGTKSAGRCLCPSDNFGDGWSTCSKCPDSSGSNAGARNSTECFCKKGSYGQAFSNGKCFACDFTSRFQQITNCPIDNLTSPLLADGWYLLNSGKLDGSFEFLKCIPTDACVEGLCAPGYEGFLCGNCASKYYRRGLSCKSCPWPGWTAIGFVLLVLFAILIVRLLWKSELMKVADFKTTFLGLQTLALLPSVSSSWPDAVSSLLNGISLANLNIDFFAPGKAEQLLVVFLFNLVRMFHQDFWILEQIRHENVSAFCVGFSCQPCYVCQKQSHSQEKVCARIVVCHPAIVHAYFLHVYSAGCWNNVSLYL
jgi:hypothetical protein